MISKLRLETWIECNVRNWVGFGADMIYIVNLVRNIVHHQSDMLASTVTLK